MKRVCAWCGRDLPQPDSGEEPGVTHGICPVCRREFIASAKAKEGDSRPPWEDVRDDSE